MSFDTLVSNVNPFKDLQSFLKVNGIISFNNLEKDDNIFGENKFEFYKNLFQLEKSNDNNENIIYDEDKYYIRTNISTDHNNVNSIGNKKNEKNKNKSNGIKKYFLIEKIDKKRKNMGRRRPKKNYKTKPSHNKFNKDNIVRKIKIHFLNSTIKYINEQYKEFQKMQIKPSKGKFLQKLETNYTGYKRKKEEKVFLTKKLGEILSGSITKRCKNHKVNYNKKNIRKLINNGEYKKLIKFLNQTVEDVYNIYIGLNGDKIPEFNLENDLEKINDEISEKGESYKYKYREYALELISILNEPGKIK